MAQSDKSIDFFLSYTAADSQWAQWIAQTLEAKGYKTELMDWDFLPGHNFVVRMQRAAQNGTRVLAVISPDYMKSAFGAPEWSAAFADDPTGENRQLIPVIVRDVDRSGLLNQIVPIDLRDKSEEAATEELLRKIGATDRLLPETPISFPGSSSQSVSLGATGADESWSALPEPMELPQLPEAPSNSWGSSAVLQLHLWPQGGRRLQMTALRGLPDELAAAGRSMRFFTASQPLTTEVRGNYALAESQPDRSVVTRGMAVNRDGVISVWDALPQDSLGAVIDIQDVEARLGDLIRLARPLVHSDNSARTGVGARLVANGMVSHGNASAVGNRSSASVLAFGDHVYEVPFEDSVTNQMLNDDVSGAAKELAARLESAWSQSSGM